MARRKPYRAIEEEALRAFGIHPGFPSSGPARPAKAKRRRKQSSQVEIPEEDLTHVVRDKFALQCGAKRFGVERSRIVADKPTCPGCKKAIRAKAEREQAAREFIQEGGEVQW